jgi:hypothetical protein
MRDLTYEEVLARVEEGEDYDEEDEYYDEEEEEESG